jgi:hypothetical protein
VPTSLSVINSTNLSYLTAELLCITLEHIEEFQGGGVMMTWIIADD